VIVLIKRHKRNLHYDVSGKDPKMIDNENNHKSDFPNPTYQGAQYVNKSIATEFSVQLED